MARNWWLLVLGLWSEVQAIPYVLLVVYKLIDRHPEDAFWPAPTFASVPSVVVAAFSVYVLYVLIRTTGFDRESWREMPILLRIPVWLFIVPILTELAIAVAMLVLALVVLLAGSGSKSVHLSPGETLRVIFD